MERLQKTQAEQELENALSNSKHQHDNMETDIELTEAELLDNTDELLILMHQRFLAGEDDQFFDYASIDQPR